MQQRAAKEVAAEQALASAHYNYNRSKALLEGTKQRLEDTFVLPEEDVQVLGVTYLSFYRSSLNNKIIRQEKDTQKASRMVDRKRDEAVQARQKRQVIEMLKDKQFTDYRREADAKEQKEVDELALYAYQRHLDNL